ncbi:MAG: epoxyqueuosine reductase QueH [Clostridia bacterium]|nr:epoxyqueuosine reductase QueH [Clostridia bacterium]
MNLENYDKMMCQILSELKKNGQTPKLLLHSCCAPCSTACLERIKDYFDITVYYYNPNLDGEQEFTLRANEQKRLCDALNIKCIIEEYNPQEFLSVAKGFEDAPEGGFRCEKCFNLRLKKTAEKALELGLDYFTTTLTVSPLKNSQLLNGIGFAVEKQTGVKFLPCDFKKRGGYLRSIELSKQYSLYRQNYCGCEFSKSRLPN